MATYKTDKKDKKDIDVPPQFRYKFKKDYEDDWDIHRQYLHSFDAYEAMLLGQVYDSVSHSIDNSKITDSYAATLAKERADRVIAKLPEGVTEPAGRADIGKAAFMDILRQKWIYPNANAQHPFLEKLNMWQLYSSVYGYMPMFYDWNVSPSGYVGPDCWLWNPRNLVPQQGRISIRDMEYVTALTWVSRTFLENVRDKKEGKVTKKKEGEIAELEEDDGWNKDAVDFLLEKVDDAKTNADTEQDTVVQRDREAHSTKRGICLATRYEAGEDGEWITFAPDHGCIEVRRLKNPHKNGRIPFVIKYSQPLFDSFYGLGDFQRAKPLQFARDGLTNFYFKGIKMNLIPPIIANANGVLKHTLDYREGAVMLETIPNSIRRLETSTAGLSTYQAAQSNLTASLLSQFGTQNASIPGAEALNPSQGKTPAAIDMYSNKEATRDGAERRHLEAAIEELTDGFFSLVVNIGTEKIPVSLFKNDIQEIVNSGLKDVTDIFKNFQPDATEQAGDLQIDPGKLKGVDYRFSIATNSTVKINKERQLQDFERFLGNLGKFQNMFKDDERVRIMWPEIMNSYEELSDIDGVSDFVQIQPGPSPQEMELMQQNQQMQQQLQQLTAQLTAMQSQAQQPQPVIAGGTTFNDPDLGGAAKLIESL